MFKRLMANDGRKNKSPSMQIVRRSETELVLVSPVPHSNQKLTVFALLALGTAIGVYVFWRAADIGSMLPTILGVPLAAIILGFMIASILLASMPFAMSFQNPVETCVLDHETGYAGVTHRVVWRLFRPQVKRYRLQDIVSVRLRRSEHNLRLDLELKSGTRVKLVEESASISSISELGELISDFLNIPLSIDLGGQTPIETYPASGDDDSGA